jgi:hypothetical protein
MLLEMENKLIAKGFQNSTSKSHKKEKSSSLPFIGMKRILKGSFGTKLTQTKQRAYGKSP